MLDTISFHELKNLQHQRLHMRLILHALELDIQESSVLMSHDPCSAYVIVTFE